MRKTEKTRSNKQTIDWSKSEAIKAQSTLILWDSELKNFGVRAGKTAQVPGIIQ